MIESVLFFALGFLFAAFLGLIAIPVILRRAATLTRRQVEREMPMSFNEIQAEKDKLRAEFAVSGRRLELSVESLRDESTRQRVALSRDHEEIKRLTVSNAEKDEVISDLRTANAELQARLDGREKELEETSGALQATRANLEARQKDADLLNRRYADAATTADNRQIELAVKDTEIDRLSGDISELRRLRKDIEAKLREATAQAKAHEETLRNERGRYAALETRLQEMMGAIADRDEKLERWEKELGRLREQARSGQSGASSMEDGSGTAAAAGRDSLDARLEQLMADKEALLGRLSAMERAAGGRGDKDGEGVELREQIKDLAAEVVHMTAELEGPDSPIRKALAVGVNGQGQPVGDAAEAVISLADRVRALQATSSEG